MACSPASTPTELSCSCRCSSGDASKSQLSPKVYGMTSGGTIPSIRSMRKNGVPSTSPVGSMNPTAGTGTSVWSPTYLMASYCSWRS